MEIEYPNFHFQLQQLTISKKTVEFQLRNATRKLGAANGITAVVAGIKTGLTAL